MKGYYRRHVTERCKLIVSRTYEWPCCGKIEKRVEHQGTESFKRHFTLKRPGCQGWWSDDSNVRGRPTKMITSKGSRAEGVVVAVDLVVEPKAAQQ